MAWLQISLQTHQDTVDLYSDYLIEAGAVSITLEDAEDEPIFEPPPEVTPLWQNTRVIGLFEADTDIHQVTQFLSQHIDLNILKTLQVKTLEDKNWIKAWMDQFQPMQFGEKLWICPTHCDVPYPTAINVFLDPGMAFGTGTHPTTRLCLEWLEAHPPQHLTVIDYGCGSGILGIAALKLGAAFVYAVDHDPQALQSTQNNRQQNGLPQDNLVTLFPKDIDTLPKADLLLANILANPLIELAATFANLIKPNGQIILSGILEDQAELLLQHYQTYCKPFVYQQHEGWVLLGFRNNQAL